MLAADNPATTGIIPVGTGNDLSRSLDVNANIEKALRIIDTGTTVDVDVAMLAAAGKTKFVFNVSSGGFSGAVDKQLANTDKTGWGMFSYLKSGIAALSELESLRGGR